mgnify:CR=1 FL=1
MSYFSKEISDVFNELGCDKNGLESKNIEKLHEKYGYNSLEEKEKATGLQIFFEQFKDFLVIILICSYLYLPIR